MMTRVITRPERVGNRQRVATMTPKQKEQFNLMRATLRRIASGYMGPHELRRCAERTFGCSPEEAIAMSYENIQMDAKCAVKGVRELK